MDFGVPRKKAVTVVVGVAFALGLPSALSLSFLDNQDYVWGKGLILSGLMFAVLIIRYGAPAFRKHLLDKDEDMEVGRWFDYAIVYLVPLQVLLLMGWWFYRAVKDLPEWWNPVAVQSIGTSVMQWGVAIALFLALNRFLKEKVVPTAQNSDTNNYDITGGNLMKKIPDESPLFDDKWRSKTIANMPTSSLFGEVFDELGELTNSGDIYLNILRKWFKEFPHGSDKDKLHLKNGLESQQNVDHLGAVNELAWFRFLESKGLKVKPLPTGKEKTPDFEVTHPLRFFCEVTTLNISKCDNEKFEKGKMIPLDQEKTIDRIVGNKLQEKIRQMNYGAAEQRPNILVIFNYSWWTGLGTQFPQAFASYLFDETRGFKKMSTKLSSIILVEREVRDGQIKFNLKQSAVYQNPFARHSFSDNIFPEFGSDNTIIIH